MDVLPLDRYLFIYFFSDAFINVLGNRVDQQCFIILRVRSVNLILEYKYDAYSGLVNSNYSGLLSMLRSDWLSYY